MYELIGEDKVPDLFQFSTSLAQSVIKKSKPTNLIETMAINSIMRLMTDSTEQPIDTFVRFKNDISQWYQEMEEFGLNEEQVKVFEEHLLSLNGVADTQESIMLMTMDKRIAGFGLKEATKLRKAVSKKKKDAAMAIKDLVFEQCEKLGNDIIMARYCWHQVERMLGYAFSSPHVLAYTLISLIEANIFYYYNPIYWQTACLTVNSGSQELDEDDKKKDKNYGKVAEAIGKMKGYGVNIALPDINHANISFTPDADNNRIVYSLKGISSINDEIAKVIIENRPYSSFEDFHTRVYQEGLIKKSQMLNLVKAGSFNEFMSAEDAMQQFVLKEVDVKKSLNMQNIKSIIRLGLLRTEELNKYEEMINFRTHIKKRKEKNNDILQMYKDQGMIKDKDNLLVLDDHAYEYFQKHYQDSLALINYNPGHILISEDVFEKEYKLFIDPLKKIISSEDFVRSFNVAQFYELWEKFAQGSVPKWEMDAVTYYSDKHELDHVNRKKYGIDNFFDIDPEPEVIERYQYRGREQTKMKIFTIIGTVLDRNKDKKQFTILTPEGVVTCKTYAGAFAHYDKTISKANAKGVKETIEKSWFTRGNLVMVKGFRREDQFVLRTNTQKGQEKEHTITLIKDIDQNGNLLLQDERYRV